MSWSPELILTGRIWPLELAGELSPSARIDGFDISPSQYPFQDWCAKNIQLTTHDAFKPFPQEYLGKYDVVHIRFFCTLVNNEDAQPLLENLVALLSKRKYYSLIFRYTSTLHLYANLILPKNLVDTSSGSNRRYTRVGQRLPILRPQAQLWTGWRK